MLKACHVIAQGFNPGFKELYSFYSAGPQSSYGKKAFCQQDGNGSIEKLKVGG
tara:strand:- start:119 stop:277 length:159 start_codon:yes stop_codon:yes gene_type:complete